MPLYYVALYDRRGRLDAIFQAYSSPAHNLATE